MTETSIHGLTTGVYAEDLGDQLATDQVIDDTVLHVNDVCDFDELGGYLLLNDAVLEYLTVDDDDSTITLAAPLTAAAAVDDRVDVWDQANNQKATAYKAVVTNLDGFEDAAPIEAVVSDQLAHALQPMMTEGNGVSTVLERSGSELEVTGILGRAFSLASLQYLQGGLTTRQAEDEAGVDILGSESGTPGILAFGDGGVLTVFVDATTGDASFIGEVGTALPGDLGVFLFSQTFSQFGELVTHPVVQFNTGASRDQPSIQADSFGSGAGLMLFSGASTGGRESRLVVDQGSITMGVEHAVDDEVYDGAVFVLSRDVINLRTDHQFGANNVAAELYGDTDSAFLGWRDAAGANIHGLAMARTGGLNLMNSSHIQVTTVDGAAFQEIDAGGFNNLSDAASKTDIADAPDAVKIIRNAPAKRWRYKTDPKSTRRIGPMADDLPRWLVGRHAKDHGVAPGQQYVDLARINGVLWRAAGQQADQIDALTERVNRLEQALADLQQNKEG